MTTKRSVLVCRRYRPARRRGCTRAAVQGTSRQKALTRKPDSDAARRLAVGERADVVTGDLGDAPSVRERCTRRRHHVSDGQQLRGRGPREEETRQGIIAAEAAKAARRRSICVYSSVADANKKTGMARSTKYGMPVSSVLRMPSLGGMVTLLLKTSSGTIFALRAGK